MNNKSFQKTKKLFFTLVLALGLLLPASTTSAAPRPPLAPDDIQFPSQWNLSGTWGINAPAAWDIETGSVDTVVAVIDSGITDHVDLDGRILLTGGGGAFYGYDFVSAANDANDDDILDPIGRDDNPLDPGDYGCDDSTWQGTHVAGIIGAASDNIIGVAGIDWNAKILPVRVSGTCGAVAAADLMDGMSWAAGLTVTGVPDNLYPANVLNVSVSAPGVACTSYQTAINNIIGTGAVIVAAAGDTGADVSTSNSFPANCTGVITVAATDEFGKRASYSNYGAAVEISAPGGGNGQSDVLSTSEASPTIPNGSADIYIGMNGTAMAAAHVSGVVSLMFAVNPLITPSQVLPILQNTAKPFNTSIDGDPLPWCTTSNCGSGIVDAGAAVTKANLPDLIITGVTLDPALPLPDQPFDVNITIKNQGGTDSSSIAYRNVYIDRAPLTIIDVDGCPTDVGDYIRTDFSDAIPPGGESTKPVTISAGLPAGSHQIYAYTDANCIVVEGIEDNNNYAPVVAGGGFSDAAVDISISGTVRGSYNILNEQYLPQSYPGLSGGPLFVDSTNNTPVVSSIRLLYKNKYLQNTLSELMGVPTSQLLDNYWMPAYIDNANMDSQIRFTNTSTTQSTTVQVFIGGALKGTYPLAPSSANRVRYSGFSGGPVQIVGTPGVPILAGMRIIYNIGQPGGDSFDEIMAYPNTLLGNEYWFPFYNHNNANLDSEIRIGNTSSSLSTTVTVYIGPTPRGTYTLAPNTNKLITYAGISGGPVHIVGTPGVPIVTSLRLLYLNRFGYKTLSELMGVPTSQLLDEYSMPVYIDNTLTDSQVRFTNTSTTQPTTVNVYLGSTWKGVYTLAPSSAERIRFTGVTGGPVRIVGTPGVPILAGMRIIYSGTGPVNGRVVTGDVSFDEIMGYPTTLLDDQYWFPFYNHNNANLDTEIRIGVP